MLHFAFGLLLIVISTILIVKYRRIFLPIAGVALILAIGVGGWAAYSKQQKETTEAAECTAAKEAHKRDTSWLKDYPIVCTTR